MFFIQLAINVAFLIISWCNRCDYIFNLFKYGNYIFVLLKIVVNFSELFSIFLVFQQLISDNEWFILTLFNGLYDFLFTVFYEILEIHLFDLLINGVIKLKFLFFLHEKWAFNAVIDWNMSTEPWMVLNVINFDSFCRINL